MNRRDLLKFFGAGAVIVPVVDGAIKTEQASRIIQPPTVEPATLQVLGASLNDLNTLLNHRDKIHIRVEMTDRNAKYVFEADSFVTQVSYGIIDITDHSGSRYRSLPGFNNGLGWTIEGRVSGSSNTTITRVS